MSVSSCCSVCLVLLFLYGSFGCGTLKRDLQQFVFDLPFHLDYIILCMVECEASYSNL